MLRTLRLALIWIMAVFIPVQGMASVSMLLCSHAAPHDEGARAASGEHAMHGHAAHDHSPNASAGKQAPGLDDPVGPPHCGADHKCSACASCCSGLALPSRVVTIASPERHSALAAVSPIHLARSDKASKRGFDASLGPADRIFAAGYRKGLILLTRGVNHYQEIIEQLLERNIGIEKYFSYIVIKSHCPIERLFPQR